MPQKNRSRSTPDLPRVHPAAAAIDIGARIHVAAVGPDRDPEPVRTFNTFTSDLHRLADWFVRCGRVAAMPVTSECQFQNGLDLPVTGQAAATTSGRPLIAAGNGTYRGQSPGSCTRLADASTATCMPAQWPHCQPLCSHQIVAAPLKGWPIARRMVTGNHERASVASRRAKAKGAKPQDHREQPLM